jgi:DNA-binding beta-propeller fold protein YncE
VALTPAGFVDLPPHRRSGFDHGDVHLASGRIFVAHTAEGTVEVIDGEPLAHVGTVPDCPEGSGVLCAQDEGLVFAAARGGGRVLILEAGSLFVAGEITTGPRPNGLAWNGRSGTLLVADVEDFRARLHRTSGDLVGEVELPGRPRWCVYDSAANRFLVNIRDPACVAVVAGEPPDIVDRWSVTSSGPHGLDLDVAGGRAFVACDGGAVCVMDVKTGRVRDRVPISGQPDAIWYNPLRRVLYVAIGNPGVVDVIDTAAMRRCQQVVTEEGAHTTALDLRRERLAVFLPRTCRAAIYQEA